MTAIAPAPLTKEAASHASDGFANFALVPTAWGLAGLRWRQVGNPGAPFAEPPSDALLTRIVTPGLAQTALRGRMAESGALEVLPESAGHFHRSTVPTWFPELLTYLQGYFSCQLRPAGQPEFLDVWAYWKPRLDLAVLTAFQLRVLSLVAQIPRGQVQTYGQIARTLGQPQAARAVGSALRANPWPILIPCHRVIGASGHLTGFTAPGGLDAKKRLLTLEGGANSRW